MLCMNIWRSGVHIEHTNNICSSYINASFATFYVQIGRLLESYWVSEDPRMFHQFWFKWKLILACLVYSMLTYLSIYRKICYVVKLLNRSVNIWETPIRKAFLVHFIKMPTRKKWEEGAKKDFLHRQVEEQML